MLSENYVTEKNVTDDSIYSMLGKYSYHEYNIDYMFNVKDSDYIHTYYVYGKFSQFSDSFNFIVILDKYNYTFSMFLNDYFDGKEYKYDDISTMKTLHIKSIKLNDYNKLEYKSISRESIAIDYYNSFIDLMEKDSNSAYALLNESYRTLRFADSNIFYKYVTDNISALKEASVSRYLVTQYDNYTDYICIDSLGNNFIFRATAINKYSVILDSYTMLLDEYVKEYNEANDEEKAMKCLYKFFEMINQDDYEKAYSILNKSFKDSNFSTLESFKQFVNDNWFNYNSIISCQISQVDGNYILNIDLADERSIGSYNSISKSGSFIVKLGENMCNFELSFKVN